MADIMDYLAGKKIIVVCGHYGAGKTNISVNLCLQLRYNLVDLDVVNPYFRGADSTADLSANGLECIVPEFANTNVDIPAVPPGIYSIFANTGRRAVIDLGGDAAGATVLGMFADKIRRESHEMVYVTNRYRSLTRDFEEAAALAKLIEEKSRLKISSVINNSNIGALTTEKEILASMDYAKKIADFLDVPLLATTSMVDVDPAFAPEHNILKIKNYTKQLF